MQKGKLYLIPSFLGEDNPAIITEQARAAVMELDEFIVENARTARRFLRAIGFKKNFDTEVTIHELEKHASRIPVEALLKNVINGKSCGIISEAGNPCIADPGNEVVACAHRHQIEVIPLVGPSAILLALIASGFNGQQFSFQGYLPIKEPDRSRAIKRLATSSATQIFMETPFRNQKLFEEVLQHAPAETLLCVACDLTLPTQFIRTQTVEHWKRDAPNLHKRYCIFLFGKA